jgi:hypothetical protein
MHSPQLIAQAWRNRAKTLPKPAPRQKRPERAHQGDEHRDDENGCGPNHRGGAARRVVGWGKDFPLSCASLTCFRARLPSSRIVAIFASNKQPRKMNEPMAMASVMFAMMTRPLNLLIAPLTIELNLQLSGLMPFQEVKSLFCVFCVPHAENQQKDQGSQKYPTSQQPTKGGADFFSDTQWKTPRSGSYEPGVIGP